MIRAYRQRRNDVASISESGGCRFADYGMSRPVRAGSGRTFRSALAFRQGDRDVEHVVFAVLDQIDLDRLGIHVDVLLDDFQQLATQQRQVVGTATRGTFLRGLESWE